MKLKTPRIAPMSDSELSAEQLNLLSPFRGQANLKPSQIFNLARTIARAREALKGFLAWGGYVLSDSNSLKERERELVILRVGYLCKCHYEWAHHCVLGRRAGLTDAEIKAISQGPDAAEWSAGDRALLTASDDLVRNHFVSDASWSSLREHFSERQCMDLVFTASQYTQVAMILNSFGVQIEQGLHSEPLPDA